MSEALGLAEVAGWSASMVVLDTLEKAAGVRLLQVEFNDLAGVVVKIAGPLGAVTSSLDAGRRLAESMRVRSTFHLVANPDAAARPGWDALEEFNPLMEQAVVKIPAALTAEEVKRQNISMGEQAGFAVGFIETQGFTAIFEAIDTACKTANVEVLAREKLGGGYIAVVIRGDVAAVTAAINAGKAKVDGLGKLIAAHVIPNPTQAVLSLLPRL
ncbi:MAG: BMC domain-containing protein [Bryobacterales bacterium]|nr:BMC domain-containing protein [Bryobacterales bacterium]